jgi:hypothetical protein
VQVTKVIKIFKTRGINIKHWLAFCNALAFLHSIFCYIYIFTHTLLLQLNWKFHVAITLLQQKHQCEENPNLLDVMNCFRDITEREIDENVIRSVPKNTEKSKNSIWRQFMSFCPKKKVIERLQYPKLHLF